MYKYREPWKALEVYKGKYFSGDWPTLPELFNITAAEFPERKCFSTYEPDLFFTYKEAHSKIISVSNYLKKIGVIKGDKVAVSGKNYSDLNPGLWQRQRDYPDGVAVSPK